MTDHYEITQSLRSQTFVIIGNILTRYFTTSEKLDQIGIEPTTNFQFSRITVSTKASLSFVTVIVCLRLKSVK